MDDGQPAFRQHHYSGPAFSAMKTNNGAWVIRTYTARGAQVVEAYQSDDEALSALRIFMSTPEPTHDAILDPLSGTPLAS